ncbi:MAG: TonB-dependent receptor, partial [Terriglobia bacterium]
MNRTITPAALLAIGVFTCAGAVGAKPLPQATGSTEGTIQGVVTDPSGAVVAGATVTLENSNVKYTQTVKTGNEGRFRLVNVPPNTYQIQISLAGFQTYGRQVDVRTNIPIQLNTKLQLASAASVVEVTAPPAALENVPAPHTDVGKNMLSNLPISATDSGLSNAITLTTGAVVADSNGFFHPQGDHGEVSYMVDGQPITDQQNKAFSTELPTNVFQSMELITASPQAEYGDKTSLVVNAATRSGLGQKPSGSLDFSYGSFGTASENATYTLGGANWGNFTAMDSSRSGRFLDTPEFWPMHDIGNSETIFDRVDYQPDQRDSLHLNAYAARNWFQVPNTYDQPLQDQRQQATTLDAALGYQHVFNPNTLLSVDPYFRQDHVQYFPSPDRFDDTPATVAENRHLTDWGAHVDLSYVKGINNISVGTELMQHRLNENLNFGITSPAFDFSASPGLLPYDLVNGGSLFLFTGSANVDEQGLYAQDQITLKNLTLNLGLRFDRYDGLSTAKMAEPRLGFSYLIKQTGTVIRGSYDRTMETPYNENLILSSETGTGGLASNIFGAYGANPLRPGRRNEFDTGFEQSLGRYVHIDANYFWKYTQNAFDFDTLFNTPIVFPIEWRKSKIDGVSARVSTISIHGFQAYTTLGHTRARFFGPETGGLIFNSPLNTGVFRIDHDQEYQQTGYLRYQHGTDGMWAQFIWRFDSGEVAGSVTDLADALALDADQQAAIGFYCGSDRATLLAPITACPSGNYGATRLNIPAPGTYNPDHN